MNSSTIKRARTHPKRSTTIKEGGDMTKKQYPLRIDSTTWDAVQLWAEDEMRSANGQIEWILRDSLKRAGRLPKKQKVKA